MFNTPTENKSYCNSNIPFLFFDMKSLKQCLLFTLVYETIQANYLTHLSCQSHTNELF